MGAEVPEGKRLRANGLRAVTALQKPPLPELTIDKIDTSRRHVCVNCVASGERGPIIIPYPKRYNFND